MRDAALTTYVHVNWGVGGFVLTTYLFVSFEIGTWKQRSLSLTHVRRPFTEADISLSVHIMVAAVSRGLGPAFDFLV